MHRRCSVGNPDSTAVVVPITSLSEGEDVTGRLLYTPVEAAALLGLGRTKIYELLLSGELRSVRIGTARRIPAAALADFVASLQEA